MKTKEELTQEYANKCAALGDMTRALRNLPEKIEQAHHELETLERELALAQPAKKPE